jgi:hypothetical protein
MAGKTDVFELDIVKLIFNGTAIANIADNAASSPLTNLYVSLHTADPTDAAASGQTTNETTYTGYARVAIARTTGGWTCATNTGVTTVVPVANITFGTCSAGTATITHVGIGTLTSGVGKLLFSGSLSPAIAVSSGVVPQITTASTITED